MTGRTTRSTNSASYRDPSGFIFTHNDRLLRQINKSFGARWNELSQSGLIDALQRRGLLIGHASADLELAFAPSTAHAVIEPEPIGFISYPYEWSFSQLKHAALLTLEAQSVASAAGFTLRDASAYNVQFRGGVPVLIDTLSFERATPGTPWLAYRQFCEHFVAPLALMAYRDVRCGLMLRDFIDGIPVDLAATLLPGRTKFDFGLVGHVHLHGRAERQHAGRDGASAKGTQARMSGLQHAALIDSLRRLIERLTWRPDRTAWADYADRTSYVDVAASSKDAIVRQLLERSKGNVVWDLGANVGRFSAVAAAVGRTVIAWDADPGATELHYLRVRESKTRTVLPLLGDLVNPSPRLGWAGVERRSFVDRANADVILALALVHHLNISRTIRLAMIADLFASLGRTLIVEFVPEGDPMVQRLLAQHDDRQPYPTLEEFRRVFAGRYTVDEEAKIEGSERVLIRMTRRA